MAETFPPMISIMQRNNHSSLKQLGTFCLGILLVGCLIQAAGWVKNDRLVFPDVPEILQAFFRLLSLPATWRKVGVTLLHLTEALAVSSFLGVSIGLAEGLSPFLRGLLRPLMTFLRSLPMIVLVVIIMVLTRYDRVPLLASVLFLIPLISEAACEGCVRIEPELLDVYRLCSSLNLRVLSRVHLPLMAGYLRQAYANAVGMGVKMVVSAEYLVQTRNSLGKAIYSSAYFNEYQDIYAYALLMILLILLVTSVPRLLARCMAVLKR